MKGNATYPTFPRPQIVGINEYFEASKDFKGKRMSQGCTSSSLFYPLLGRMIHKNRSPLKEAEGIAIPTLKIKTRLYTKLTTLEFISPVLDYFKITSNTHFGRGNAFLWR